MLSCTLYKATGLNSINLPDSPARLSVWGTAVKTTALDCLQGRFLSYIDVKTTWADIQDVDYVVVDGFYYTVAGIQMTSYDVARIQLVPDFITSAGGPSTLEYLDGITERVHVPVASDTYGAYAEDDDYLAPAQPLELVLTDELFDTTQDGYMHVAESSVDLGRMGGTDPTTDPYIAQTFTYAATGETYEVTVPRTIPTDGETEYGLGASQAVHPSTTTGGQLFDVDFTTTDGSVRAGIQLCRDLGVEDAIVSSYALPRKFFGSFIKDPDNGAFTLIASDFLVEQPLVARFGYEYAAVYNMRLLYGEYCTYGLLTAAGNSSEYRGEVIYDGGTSPSVVCVADGRYDGTPVFAFSSYYGTPSDLSHLSQLFANSVEGAHWQSVPLKYTTAPASIQSMYTFTTQEKLRTISYEESRVSALPGVYETGKDLAYSTANAAVSAALGPLGLIAGAGQLANAAGHALELNSQLFSMESAYETYKVQSASELRNYAISQAVVKPKISFPPSSSAVRDYYGNGVLAYRYCYSAADLARLDRLLTAFGYRVTKMLDAGDFTTRPNFNYVRASGVSVGGDLPGWWKSGIADQLAAGARFWHVKPNATAYTTGNR